MIDPLSFNRAFLLNQQSLLGISDPFPLERAVHAFALLERLALSKLDLIFKGGTAVMLLLGQPRRISTDVDIVCLAPPRVFEAALKKWIRHPPFLRWERDFRGTDNEPPHRRHYQVFFHSQFQPGAPAYIILDVVSQDCGIPDKHLIFRNIDCPFLALSGVPSLVKTPCVDALLGDKLTAFAPNTTGVPFHDSRRLDDSSHQVLKQLFDIAQLFDHMTDIGVVRESYLAVSNREGSYRHLTGLPERALYDTLQTAFTISTLGTRRKKYPNDDLIQRGIKSMASDLIHQTSFALPQARLAAAKAAYLSTLILTGKQCSRYINTPDIQALLRQYEFPVELGVLNPLKKVSAEAFWYWREIYHLAPKLTESLAK